MLPSGATSHGGPGQCPPLCLPLALLHSGEAAPAWTAVCAQHASPHHCTLCFLVGGLKSPWRGEYKEPRHPPPNQANYHQTLHAQPRELSPRAPGPRPAEETTGRAPKLQPPLPPEPPEPNKSPPLTLSKEESGMWEPLPLSSLEPAPARNPSSPERKATFPEQELQQLEIGTGSRGCSGALSTGPGPPAEAGVSLYLRCGLSSSPFPSSSASTDCAGRTPENTASLLPVFHSHLPLFPAELFLNSLSQPFSLEEQEQILSCLSIDSLSLSDDSEKVSRLWPRSHGSRGVVLPALAQSK